VEIKTQTDESATLRRVTCSTSARSQRRYAQPVMLFPGIAPRHRGGCRWQGHETFTRYASGRGVIPIAILARAGEARTGALAGRRPSVKLARAGARRRPLISSRAEMRAHPREGETR